MFWVVCAVLPFVASLQRYSVAYGYEGVSRRMALRDAKFAGLGTLLFLVLPVILWHLATRGAP